jgi:membrane protease subunit (stomatin/prohibitin family)
MKIKREIREDEPCWRCGKLAQRNFCYSCGREHKTGYIHGFYCGVGFYCKACAEHENNGIKILRGELNGGDLRYV